jgi:hypothetical protein
VATALLLGACSTTFNERHFFKSPGAKGAAPNYYRLDIKGNVRFSSARYVSGYYDETAVDLLFNELKSPKPGTDSKSASGASASATPASAAGAAKPPTTAGAAASPAGGAQKPGASAPAPAPADATSTLPASGQLTPLDSSKPGSFVLILSTNADAVADTIGNFAESNVTAQAITNLVNRDRLRTAQQTASKQATLKADASAVSSELTSLLGQLPSSAPKSQPTVNAYLRVLSAISRALGSGQDFQRLQDAATWFSAARLSAKED